MDKRSTHTDQIIDPAIERWLRLEVVPVCDAHRENPDRALSADAVFDAIRDRHAEMVSGSTSHPET